MCQVSDTCMSRRFCGSRRAVPAGTGPRSWLRLMDDGRPSSFFGLLCSNSNVQAGPETGVARGPPSHRCAGYGRSTKWHNHNDGSAPLSQKATDPEGPSASISTQLMALMTQIFGILICFWHVQWEQVHPFCAVQKKTGASHDPNQGTLLQRHYMPMIGIHRPY